MKNIDFAILDLVEYAEEKNLLAKEDHTFAINNLLTLLRRSDFDATGYGNTRRPLEEILEQLCDYAAENGLLEANTVVYRDLFDTALMGAVTPAPHEIITRFRRLYATSPADATDYFYNLAKDSNYIRTYRVEKDLKWTAPSKYGDIDITINLSKPEKDPVAIAAAKLLPPSGYPKCLLCHECEGYAGTVARPARQNLRQIPITMDNAQWYFQYSPYVYYNEHCIVLSGKHTPMQIGHSTFVKLLDFVEQFPHYFIGSNADLPIVGGSILSHDHMQGGRYTFAMEKAPIETPLTFAGYENVQAGLVHWPMSVIRLSCPEKEPLIGLADHILDTWREYTDEDAFIFAKTKDGEQHNTITPIARMRDGAFELDLVLRNNITTKEHPLGLFHPHADLHNIKKENIGLIEVMGLAVLPARLKDEMEQMEHAILNREDINDIPALKKHAAWFARFAGKYEFTAENVHEILQKEIGDTFVRVLKDAGVYKRTTEGRDAFLRFCAEAGAKQ